MRSCDEFSKRRAKSRQNRRMLAAARLSPACEAATQLHKRRDRRDATTRGRTLQLGREDVQRAHDRLCRASCVTRKLCPWIA